VNGNDVTYQATTVYRAAIFPVNPCVVQPNMVYCASIQAYQGWWGCTPFVSLDAISAISPRLNCTVIDQCNSSAKNY